MDTHQHAFGILLLPVPINQMPVKNNYLKASQETHKAEFQQMCLFCLLITIRYYQKMIRLLPLKLFTALYQACCGFVYTRQAESASNRLGQSIRLNILIKTYNFQMEVLINQNIFGFQISVHNLSFVQVLQSRYNLCCIYSSELLTKSSYKVKHV